MNILHRLLWLRSWKDFSFGWWNVLASAWFLDVCHFENLTLWIQLCLGLRDRAWKATNGNSRKLAQLSMTIFSKFWSWDRYPICIHGSRARCSTGIAQQVTSKLLTWCFRGRPLACHFANTSICGNGKICPFEDNKKNLQRKCFINLWIQTVLFLIIAIATSATVSWQFAGFRQFYFGWSFRFQQIIFQYC